MRSSQKRLVSILVCALFALFTLAVNVSAQDLTGKIRGAVTDPLGASVPGAEVKATNVQTQVSATVPTETDGTFQFLSLPAGTYDVTVSKAGFRTVTTQRVNLSVATTFDLPVKLEVGQITESVQVEASPVQVESTSSQLSTVVGAQTIVDLPLNGRNWTQLQQLAPGVVSSSDRFGTYSTNGSQSNQNSFLVNGMDAIDLPLNTPSIIPSPDAIGEFNLMTSTIDAQYGRNSGGILNAIIKSGTNQVHGTAFEFYRDTFLNDHNFFQVTAPKFHQNQFGGVLTGPIRKNHTFFMFSYQGTRAVSPQSGGSVPVFSSAQRSGIFTGLATSASTSPFPLIGESGASYPAGTAYKTIFPTGHIPAADFNSVSQKYLSFVPPSNIPGGLYSFNPVTTRTDDQEIVRIDHTMQRDTLWGTLFLERNPTLDTLPFTGSTLPGFGDQNLRHYKAADLSWTHTFNPTTINDLRLSLLRFNYGAVVPQVPALPSTFGFTGINPQNTEQAGIPYVAVTGYFALGFSTNGPQPRIDSTYQLTDSFSKVVGNHTFKAGFDGKRYQVKNPFFGNNNGNFSFGGNGAYSTGDPAADFMLGIPDGYSQSSGGYIDARSYQYYFYAQDSWKASRDVTLNYGVGYTIDTPLENHHFNNLDKNCFRPGQQSTIFPSAPVGLVFPGDNGCTLSGYSTHYTHFGPRLGIAYSPDSKLSIRAGVGLYYDRSEEELALQDLGAVPFSLGSGGIGDIGGSPSFKNPFVDIATGQSLPNKFPLVVPAAGSKPDFSFFEPMSINVIDPKFTSPRTLNYNIGIQRELKGAMIAEIRYVGSISRHLEMTWEGNPITPAGVAACAASPSCIADRLNQAVDYPTHTEYAPGNVFASVGTQGTVGNSHYNSLQASLKKRLSHGVTFSASYTWSHSLDNASGYENSYALAVDPYNFHSTYGDSSFDARQRFVIQYDYQLPRFASRLWDNAFTRKVIDGWALTGITTLQTGFPVTVTDSSYKSLTCSANWVYYACSDVPNVVNGPVQSLNIRTDSLINKVNSATATTVRTYYWFDPNNFAHGAYGVLGNSRRNFFHAPGINNTDLAVFKNFTAVEGRFVQLRLEAYNVFNHTQFGAPGANANSSTFGRVTSAASGRTVQLAAKIYF